MKTLLIDGFTYAFRGNGKFNFIMGACLFLGEKIMSFAPIVGPIAVLLLGCYLIATYYGMVETSAGGAEEAPMFPEVTNLFEDVIYPNLKLIAIGVLSYSPFIAYAFLVPDSRESAFISTGLLITCTAYYLMAQLAVMILGRLSAMSPHIVFPAIKRAGSVYWVAFGCIIVLSALGVGLQNITGKVPLIGAIPQSAMSMYLLMTSARLLGLIYREREEQLDWL